jgi:6-phosphofructo-2-kinase / fructose-2,6-biphosphatase 2
MNLNTLSKAFFISRHGESMFNVTGKIGGDSDLSPQGQVFANLLPKVIQEQVGDHKLIIWTSTLKRTIQTAADIPFTKMQWKQLDELNSGSCDGLTYEQIEEQYPLDFAERDNDKCSIYVT